MKINKKVIKVIGLAATILGAGVSLVQNWVSEKNLDDKISEKVAEALSKQTEETES